MGMLSIFKKISSEIIESMPEEQSKNVLNYYTKKNFNVNEIIPLPVFSHKIGKDLKLSQKNNYFVTKLSSLVYLMADMYDDCEDDEVPEQFEKKIVLATASALQNMIMTEIVNGDLNCLTKERFFKTVSQHLTNMVKGQILDLTYIPTGDTYLFDIPKLKAGSEVALFFILPCIISENPQCSVIGRLGTLFGEFLQILSDYVDIWYKDFSNDIYSLKPTLPIFLGLKSDNPEFSRLIAQDRADESVQMQIRQVLIKLGAHKVFESYFLQNRKEVQKLLQQIRVLKSVKNYLNKLYDTGEELITVLYELEDEI